MFTFAVRESPKGSFRKKRVESRVCPQVKLGMPLVFGRRSFVSTPPIDGATRAPKRCRRRRRRCGHFRRLKIETQKDQKN